MEISFSEKGCVTGAMTPGYVVSDGTANVVRSVEELVSPLLVDMGIELVEVEFRREGHGWVLRLYIDREGGVTLDDCAAVSREVSRYLEVEEPIEHAYHLEVSSPGLERPLRKKEDFIRFAGRKVRIKLQQKVEEQRVYVGTLQGMEGEDILLLVDERQLHFPLADISKARLVFEAYASGKGTGN